jgi:hypothetical protein
MKDHVTRKHMIRLVNMLVNVVVATCSRLRIMVPDDPVPRVRTPVGRRDEPIYGRGGRQLFE